MEEILLLAISCLVGGLAVLLHLCWRCCAGKTAIFKDLEEGNETELKYGRIPGVACRFENESKSKRLASISNATAAQTVRGIVFEAVNDAIQTANLKIAQEIEDLKHACSVYATIFADLKPQTRCDSKKNKLVIFGLPDSPSERSFQLEQKLDSLVWRKLNASLNEYIEDAYWLGRSTLAQTGTRPVLVKFQRTLDCQNVLREKKRLNGTGIQIKPHRTKEEREMHRVYWEKFQDLKMLDGEITKFHVGTDGIMTVWKNDLPVRKFSYHPDQGVVELFQLGD